MWISPEEDDFIGFHLYVSICQNGFQLRSGLFGLMPRFGCRHERRAFIDPLVEHRIKGLDGRRIDSDQPAFPVGQVEYGWIGVLLCKLIYDNQEMPPSFSSSSYFSSSLSLILEN